MKRGFTLAEVPKALHYTRLRSKGFTLAEVLITLAVIGVVVAMTIPTLVSDISRKQHLTAFKKKYAEIVEAVKLSTIDNMSPSKWNYDLEDDEFFAAYLAPYLKTTRCDDCWISYEPKGLWFETPAYAAGASCVWDDAIEKACYANNNPSDVADVEAGEDCCLAELKRCLSGTSSSSLCSAWLATQKPSNVPPEEPDKVYSLVNGSTLGIAKMDSFFYLYLDVNGKGAPNVYGADQFLLTVVDDNVKPYGYGKEDLTTGEYGCSTEGNGMYCGAMIMQNNWDYPEDYPKL